MVASSSYPIDIADQAKVLQVKFSYSVITLGGGNFSGTSSNSYAWAMYDVTNSAWLSSAGNFCMIQSTGVGNCTGTVQTAATTANIRLVLYNANATTGAATTYFDDFYVGPQTAPMGPAMTDWGNVAWTPTGTWTTNTTYTGFYRRVGDSLEAWVYTSLSGAPTGNYTINLPSGLSINTAKLITSGIATPIGEAAAIHSNYYNGVVLYASSTSVQVATNAGSAAWNATSPVTWASGDSQSVHFTVPIVGWSSNTAMSSDTDTRVVAMQNYLAAPTATITNSDSLLKFGTAPGQDTHGAFSTGTGLYTVPVTGFYRVTASVNFTGTWTVGQVSRIGIEQNGVMGPQNVDISGGTTTVMIVNVSGTVYAKTGDTLGPYVSSNGSSPVVGSNVNSNYFLVERLSGPATIAATESVNARYHQSGTQSISTGSETALTLLTVKDYDSHNAFNTGTGAYTCPVSGKYHFTLQVASNSTVTAGSVGTTFQADIVASGGAGTSANPGSAMWASTTTAMPYSTVLTDSINCPAGGVITFETYQTLASTVTVGGGEIAMYMEIERVGN
jgi:hypothetical protein